jgi:hypothetical protein
VSSEKIKRDYKNKSSSELFENPYLNGGVVGLCVFELLVLRQSLRTDRRVDIIFALLESVEVDLDVTGENSVSICSLRVAAEANLT